MRGDLPPGRLKYCLEFLDLCLKMSRLLADHQAIVTQLQVNLSPCLEDEQKLRDTTLWLGIILNEARQHGIPIRPRQILTHWHGLTHALLAFDTDNRAEKFYRERLQVLAESAISQPQRFLHQSVRCGASGLTNLDDFLRWTQVLEMELHPEPYFFPIPTAGPNE